MTSFNFSKVNLHDFTEDHEDKYFLLNYNTMNIDDDFSNEKGKYYLMDYNKQWYYSSFGFSPDQKLNPCYFINSSKREKNLILDIHNFFNNPNKSYSSFYADFLLNDPYHPKYIFSHKSGYKEFYLNKFRNIKDLSFYQVQKFIIYEENSFSFYNDLYKRLTLIQ